MTDVFDAETRSRVMSRVRCKNTKPEIQVRKALHEAGFRFRLHRKDLPGNPDVVLPRYRVVVFVNGCFWHGHGCKRSRLPGSNAEYWQTKIEKNVERDISNYRGLEEVGWRVHVVWTCDMKGGTEALLALLRCLAARQSPSLPQDCYS